MELTILRTVVGLYDYSRCGNGRGEYEARIPVAGFAIFIVASIAWMADGLFENKPSLVIQNAIHLLINILGGAGCQWLRMRQASLDQSLLGSSFVKD